MPVDASIPLQVQQPNFGSPLQAAQQAMSMKDLMQRSQLQNLQIQQQQQNMANQILMAKIAAVPGNVDNGMWTADGLKQLTDANPLLAQDVTAKQNEKQFKIEQLALEKGRVAVENRKAQTEALNDSMSEALAKAKAEGKGDPSATEAAFQRIWAEERADLQKSGVFGSSQVKNFDYKTAEQMSMAHAPEAVKLQAINDARERITEMQTNLTHLKPGSPEANVLAAKIKDATFALQNVTGERLAISEAERERHDKEMEAMRGRSEARMAAALAQRNAPPDADAMKGAIDYYKVNGQFPPGMSRNPRFVASALGQMSREAEAAGDTGTAILLRAKATKADQASLTGLTKMSDAVESFAKTTEKNMDMLVEQSKKVPRAAWPLINKAIITGKLETGDTEALKYFDIIRPVANEYARVMSGATGAAGATDAARKEAADMLSPYMSPENVRGLVPFLKQEIGNRKSSNTEQMEEIKARMADNARGPGKKTEAPKADTVHVQGKAMTRPAGWSDTLWDKYKKDMGIN